MINRLLPLLVGAVAFLGVGLVWHRVAPMCVVGAGLLLTVAAARDNRSLLGVALLAFGVRAVPAVLLQWIAQLDVAALFPLTTRAFSGYRFWIFAFDSSSYHRDALRTLVAWQQQLELPPEAGKEYFVFTAANYFLFGANPLNAVLWNALFGSLAVVVGYRIATRLAGPTAATPTALLIALWPSAVLWSTQLLKDALCLWLTLVLMYLTMRAVDAPSPRASTWPGVARWIGLVLLLVGVTLLLYRFRKYVLLVLIAAPAVFVVQALIRRTPKRWWQVFAACTVMGIMMLTFWTSRRIDFDRLVAFPFPELTHVNFGVMAESRGDPDTAWEHYQHALELVPNYPPALRRLGALALARGDRGVATGYFKRYLRAEPRDGQIRAVLDSLAPKPRGASDRTAPPVIAPTAIPVPTASMSITGPRSDAALGWRELRFANLPLGLNYVRQVMRQEAYSLIDPEVRFRGYADVLRYLPRALAHVFLAPYPWQWTDTRGGTGAFKVLSAVEVILLYVCLVPLVVGLARTLATWSGDALYVAAVVIAMATALGLGVSNLGTLFRLRLEALIPLFTAAGLGWAWLLSLRGRWSAC